MKILSPTISRVQVNGLGGGVWDFLEDTRSCPKYYWLYLIFNTNLQFNMCLLVDHQWVKQVCKEEMNILGLQLKQPKRIIYKL